jgi:hypothetical protein
MSIYIEQDRSTKEYIDYFFECAVRTNDPRYKQRNINIGTNRGLFRIYKANLNAALLLPMENDNGGIFSRAASKIITIYNEKGEFPLKAQRICG